MIFRIEKITDTVVSLKTLWIYFVVKNRNAVPRQAFALERK